ncbi:MAG TPA: hypothetical protein VFP34_12105, partial [Microlunatus sp.]|nr:hypothetical protein [Microlunatus sp.]
GAGGGPGGGPGGGGGQPGQSTGGQSSGGGGTGGGGTGGGSGPDQAANRAFAGKWFAVDLWTISGTVVDGNARLAALRAQNVPAGLVQSTLYPNATPVIKSPSWILYSGPYDTPAQAQAACGAVRQASVSCLTMQLQP